jgi:hypothetical protein
VNSTCYPSFYVLIYFGAASSRTVRRGERSHDHRTTEGAW